MEIKITVTPKEIADLVKSLQSQPAASLTIALDGKTIFQDFQKANNDNLVERCRQSRSSQSLCR